MKDKMAYTNDEKGSAILLSLGILSLVLILAMGFAFSANTQKSIAKTQGAATAARMVADEAVELAIADMKWMFDQTERNGKKVAELPFPPETMNVEKAFSSDTTTLTFNQDCFLWKRYNTSSSDMNTLYYLLSTDVSRSSVSDWEHHHLGELFGLAAPTTKTEDVYTSSSLTADWLNANDLEGKVDFLPQLQFLGPQLSGALQFAPPLTMTYALHDEDGNSTDITKVTGRYAYILLDETARFDLNAVISLTGEVPTAVDHTGKTADADQNRVLGGGMYCDRLAPEVEITNSPDCKFEFDVYDSTEGAKNTDGRLKEEFSFRMGLLPEEIIVDEKYVDAMLGTKVKTPFESYEQLSASATTGTNKTSFISSSASDSEMFKYTFFSLEDIEAYWDDNEKTELQRFDLSGVSWGGNKGDNKLFTGTDNAWEYGKNSQDKSRELIWRLCGLNLTDKPDADPPEPPLPFWDDRAAGSRFYSVERTHNGMAGTGDALYEGYLDWLHRMSDDDGKCVGVQVAANIKDFSDSDDYASTDFNVTASAPSGDDYASPEAFKEPNYCGNERVCYFNEIAVKSNSYGSYDETNGGWTHTVSLRVGVEMLNIYCLPGKENCGAVNKTAGESGACTVELGNVHVKVFGTLHAWRQKYEEKPDPNFVGEGTAPKVWLPVEGGLEEPYNWPLKSSDATGKEFLSLNSYDADCSFELNGTPKTLADDKHHLGFTTFYLEVRKDLSELKDIVATATDTDLEAIRADLASQNGKEYRYCFLFEITNVVAYSTELGDDNMEKLYDVAVMPKAQSGKLFTESTEKIAKERLEEALDMGSGASFASNKTIVSFQAKDCRFNHRSDEKFWIVKSMEENGDEATNPHTLGADNSEDGTATVYQTAVGVDANVDMEKDIAFKAAGSAGQRTFSTAFIRNAPMESLWELGAIHRGYPNQTINLKEYSDRADEMYYSTTDKPAGGDAGILDQVKIGPLMFVRGKVNANQRNPKVWEHLLTDNMDYEWYDGGVCEDMASDSDMAVVGVNKAAWEIDSDGIAKLKDGTAWEDLPADKPTSYSRGAVATMMEKLLMSKGTAPVNDRDYEYYIGRTAGLLTTRCEAYSLLLVAETLNDMTDELTQTEWNAVKNTLVNPQTVMADIGGTLSERYCTVIGRQKVLVHLLRDAWRNEITVHSKKYLQAE